MLPTTSGETPRKKVFDKPSYENFYLQEKSNYEKFVNSKLLYQHGHVVKNVFNYLNQKSELKQYQELKKIITTEYENCEKVFPLLGDLFLYFLFNEQKNIRKYKPFRLRKKSLSNVIYNSCHNEDAKNIIKYFIDNCNINYNIYFEKSNIDEIVLEKDNAISLDNSFDISFFNRNIVSKNYYFFLLNGFIDKISEIHHILYDSSQNKEKDYIIFCLGMSDDVKVNVMKNNALRNTKVHIVSFDFNEENINIMADLSVLLNKEVISADKGQTLSQAILDKKNIGREIKIDINNKKISILPNASIDKIKDHLSYLNSRIQNSDNEINKKYIQKRIKNISANNFRIFLTKDSFSDFDFMKDLDYFFNIIKNINLNFIIMSKVIGKESYAVPYGFAKIAYEKSKSINKILNSIEKQILCLE